MTIGARIRKAREDAGMTMEGLGAACGITKQTIFKYEQGVITNIPIDRILQLADVLHVPAAWIAGWETIPSASNIIPMPEMKKVPLIGEIACGEPILAEENIEEQIDIPAHIHADFALRCKGDSMINARIFDGDIVYIRQQPMVEDGEIAAVRMDDVATLKRVRLFPDHVVLEAANPQFEPMAFWRDAMNDVDIIGKAVAFTSSIRQ